MVCNIQSTKRIETGTKIFNSPHVFVFANQPPDNTDDLSSDHDRWNIVELQGPSVGYPLLTYSLRSVCYVIRLLTYFKF
jgi:hypothetical protein